MSTFTYKFLRLEGNSPIRAAIKAIAMKIGFRAYLSPRHWFLAISAFFLLLSAFSAVAQPNVSTPNNLSVSNLLFFTTVNGTNTGDSALYTRALVTKLPVFQLESGPITNSNSLTNATNAILWEIQVSVDNTNYLTLTNARPNVTNAAVRTFAPDLSRLPIYFRVRTITTNGLPAGAKAMVPQ